MAEAYRQWLEALPEEHPKWDHAGTRKAHYLNVVMSLFVCQQGLCAYTEQLLCDPSLLTEENWAKDETGTIRMYQNQQAAYKGHADHFDESLKAKKHDPSGRKDWLWDNLFMVASDTNTKDKGTKAVDAILKPDGPDYEPFSLLVYNQQAHLFIPSPDRAPEEKERIKSMILTLGLNHPTVVRLRRGHLAQALRLEQYEIPESIDDQFPTALEMCRRQILGGADSR